MLTTNQIDTYKRNSTATAVQPLDHRVDFEFHVVSTYGILQADASGTGPRQDPETGKGVCTDAKPKRGLRDFWTLLGIPVFIRRQAVLETLTKDAAKEVGVSLGEADLSAEADSDEEGDETEEDASKANGKGEKKGKKKVSHPDAQKVIARLCHDYLDVRAFGAVLGALGGVRGPVQIGMGCTVKPINILDLTITRQAVQTEKESKAQAGHNHTMGDRPVVPHGLYVFRGSVNPADAARTGFSKADLDFLLEGLLTMFDSAQSSTGGTIAVPRVFVFEHASKLGDAPAHKLHELISVTTEMKAPRSYADYTVAVGAMPAGVTLRVLGEPLA